MKLHDLACQHRSNKASMKLHGRSFLDVYQLYLDPIRDEVTALIELGVYNGGSLKMWAEYLPKAMITGVDIDPLREGIKGERIEVVIQSQEKYEGKPCDVIIDDASHINMLTTMSFANLWRCLRPGGLYFIEDLGPSYRDISEESRTWPGQHLNTVRGYNYRALLDGLFMQLVRDLDLNPETDVDFVHFWHEMCVIGKAKR